MDLYTQERADRGRFAGSVSFTRSECDAAEFVRPRWPFFPSPLRIGVPPEISNDPHPRSEFTSYLHEDEQK